MISTILSIVLFLIFLVLSGFHFYWLFGGTWGLGSVFPTKNNEPSNIKIPPIATLIVAMGLLGFGLIYLVKAGLLNSSLPHWLNFVYWFIPIIFIVRAIGEFNYVGLFKRIKDTKFANADSKIFVPLCLSIGIIGILIQLMNK